MINRLIIVVFKPALSSFLFGLGTLINSQRLIRKALRLDPDNVKAHLQLLAASGFDFQAMNRFFLAPRFVGEMGITRAGFVESNFSDSKSQLFQDLFVLIHLNERRGGYFVEIGVGSGEYLSNTWLLEKKYQWKGILAEPNRHFLKQIKGVRSVAIDDRAVWKTTGSTLDFLDVGSLKELSTIKMFKNSDQYPRDGETYPVRTVSLNDLLAEHQAPTDIDYVSIDTEGSEWEILKDFNFEKYKVSIFTIEHNYSAEKLSNIRNLLIRHGYVQVLEGFTRFDAWFVAQRLFISEKISDINRR